MAMAIFVDVWLSVRTGMEKVWELGQQVRHQAIARVSIRQLLETSVIAEFLMSLSVLLASVMISFTAIYCFDPEFFFTNQDNCRFLVTKLHASIGADRSVRLEWKKPEIEAIRYEVEISSDVSADQVLEVDAWTESSVIINTLIPGVQYSFCVVSMVTIEDGQEITLSSKIVNIITNPSPPDSMNWHMIHVLEAHHVELSWKASKGKVDGYSVVLKNCMEDVMAEETTTTTHLSISLGNHRISTAYFVEIHSLSHGERSDPLRKMIQVEELDLIVRQLHATMQDTKSVKLKWKHPVNGPADSYDIQWALEHSDQFNVITVDSDMTWTIIKDLTPRKTYIFRVESIFPRECGLKENFLSRDISFTLSPTMPGKVTSTIKSTSFELEWKASEGRVDYYIVKISHSQDSTFRAEYQTESPSLHIENLEVNTLYQLTIFAVFGNLKSEPRTEELRTKNIQVYWGCIMKAILTGGITIAGVSALSPVLGILGFGAAGIGKSTLAAAWMSSYGGTVASGSFFSILQSLGAVGLGASAKAAIIASGMALGCIAEVV